MDDQDEDGDARGDLRCMERLRAGDDLALNDLMRRWKEPLAAFCLRYTGNPTDAREIAHETFVRVYSARNRYRPTGAFSTWLFAIAANLCRMRNRWRARHPEVLESDRGPGSPADEPAAPPGACDPSAAADRHDLARDLDAAVRRLPHDLRTAFLLREIQGLSCREIAGVQGTTEKATERRLARAREKLRSLLAPKWGAG
jgi:RNA polymerase sigma-70 factor (ECF subfamily)